jgi:F-type H+-transporting ATPase subunit b
MPEFNATLLFVLLSFVVFMLLMKAVFFDPMLKIKAQREQQLQQDQDSAKRFDEEHATLSADYEAALQKARREAQQVLQRIREEAKSGASETLLRARMEAQSQMERELADLSQWRERTYQELEPERQALKQLIISRITEQTPVATVLSA